ncbi:serine hydrolase domain-containing protein [Saccharothrix algeriensis]|uniref:CubicO group peptidase (Beta-lactamase class C family) n=3 Tax=Saccharothrix algeriensis TaxID=173560 RepID=A0ABS2S591_9PSEU|nr:serine hydrolase domain-containing protein [Saccharothrix algeriensis]MBM7810473.1 CubicO group peptidase (beta-lactamase class C family) [Saccharothrix algeriensis]
MERSGELPGRARAAGEWIGEVLPELAARHGLPGAQVAVLVDGEVVDAATGVLNLATGVPVTSEALFQIGSITKVWTATLVMQLVREGAVDLDRPVSEYLDRFRLADEAASRAVTIRQLLSHTGGFDGDIWTDTGRNEDAVRKYVEGLAEAVQYFAPGERFSYCNSGYMVLGRLVEVLRGKSYNRALREHLITPLGLTHVATCVDEAILAMPAVGHERARPGGLLEPVKKWSLVPATAPVGAMLAMSARELLGFVRHHLSTPEYNAMRKLQVEVPEPGLINGHWGLGWSMPDYGGPVVVGHSGYTMGQRAFVRVVPDAGVAVAMLTNGGDVYPVFTEVFGHLLHELAGVRQPELPSPPENPRPVDANRVVGTYRSSAGDWVVRVDADGRAWVRVSSSDEDEDEEELELVALNEDALITLVPQEGRHVVYGLGDADAAGRARFLRLTGRAIVRDLVNG